MRPLVALTLCTFLPHSAAAAVVDPGGEIASLAADAVRPVVYAALETSEIVAIDLVSQTVTDRLLLPDEPTQMAVAADGSLLYVGLATTFDVAVVELAPFRLQTTIDVGLTSRPYGIVGSPDRLYVAADNELSIIDATVPAELWLGDPLPWFTHNLYHPQLAISPDHRTVYTLTSGSPALVSAICVSGDAPVFLGQHCCHGCFGSSGKQLQVSSDGTRLHLITAEGRLFGLDATRPLLREAQAMPVGLFPRAFATTASQDRVFLAYDSRELLFADTIDWLPSDFATLSANVDERGLVLSADATTLAAAIRVSAPIDPDRVELIDVSAVIHSSGGVRLRAIDDLTGQPVDGAFVSGTDGWGGPLDRDRGVIARVKLPPGPTTITVSASGYTPVDLNLALTAGQWSDAGDVVLTRTGALPAPDDACVSPQLIVGETQDVLIHGRGFDLQPGLDVEVTDPDLTLNHFTAVSSNLISANITVAASATDRLGSIGVKVRNPDMRFTNVNYFIVDWSSLTELPPNAISALLAVESAPLDVQLIWTDPLVDAQHAPADDYSVWRALDRADRGWVIRAVQADGATAIESWSDAEALDPATTGSGLHFYRVVARNQCGRLTSDSP